MKATPIVDHVARATDWIALVDLRTVAATLNVHPATVRRWAASGTVPAPVRIGSRLFFRRDDLRRLATQRTGPVDGDPMNRSADGPCDVL